MNRAPRWRWVLACVATSFAATQLVGPSAHAGEGRVPEAPASPLPAAASTGSTSAARPSLPAAPAGHELLQSPEDALAQDLALVADARGWTVAQAAAHHRSAEAVGAVAERLAATRPEVFVGSALPSDPEGAPLLYVKGLADADVLALAATSPVPIVVADGQPYSFDELEARKLLVHHALEAMGFLDIATGFKPDGAGVITSAVTALPGLPRDPALVTAALPASIRDSVRLTVHDEDVVVDEHAFGGMRVSSATSICTSGWSVFHPNGTTGVTTAGHCDGINSITEPGVGDHALAHQQEHRGEWGDVEWKTSAHSEPAQFYATSTAIRRTNFLEARANISVNESVCLYGRSSNNRQCLPVFDTSEACTNSGVFNDRLVIVDGDVGVGGDSGGGWSFNSTAFGSHKGNCGTREAFSVADLYDEALSGVRVRLSATLPTNVTLHEEDRLVSTDGRFTAIMQNDGNFVVYQAGVGAIWASGTNGNWGARLVMQGDGNLVIYRTNGTAAWATMTFGSGHVLVMQNDGNLVMYGAGARWASNTCCR